MTAKSRSTDGLGRLYDSILDTMGNTPCVRLNNIAPDGKTIYVKAEYFNPLSSVKDRLAISVIDEAERIGALKPGQTVVEATSGNTGIGLALIANAKGYKCIFAMGRGIAKEKIEMMKTFGTGRTFRPRRPSARRARTPGARAPGSSPDHGRGRG